MPEVTADTAPATKRKRQEGTEREDAIYQSISDAVVEHRLKPGSRLREDALSEVFGVSRTGIRKVLQRLAMEQLVTIAPRRGASVARPSADEAREVFAARQMIECGLMPEVASRVTKSEIAELRMLAKREVDALRDGNNSVAIRTSSEFHERLAQMSGNKTLAEFVGRLCSRSSLILAVYGNSASDHMGCESHDHDELVRLLEAGDGAGASQFMLDHLKAVEGSLSIVEGAEEVPDLYSIFGN
ncbi:GntR family transcriptional regulator [Microbulbifer sp. CAU 1566]|uniref:GntR family transcriptional regulator n=1 Tax=Microbulbifer sp. CAU 1566 TaxID=2933269 RepID=UPI00200496B9|nr:GntR family transcriptional regulator [Microbulbifer sp. CAU 1566]MCK7596100.1 GntR family transcriptional regulator [Microbulbifer sp. CAU 1566]